jgi:hypothetical protein
MNQGNVIANSSPLVFPKRMSTRENQGVDIAQGVLESRRVAPRLGRPLPVYAAPNASWAIARLSIKFPEQVHRANQPMLMRSHEPHCAPIRAQTEDSRPSYQ